MMELCLNSVLPGRRLRSRGLQHSQHSLDSTVHKALERQKHYKISFLRAIAAIKEAHKNTASVQDCQVHNQMKVQFNPLARCEPPPSDKVWKKAAPSPLPLFVSLSS